jgi:hypothetical protein
MMHDKLIRGCGVALCAAAILTLAINVFVSPLLPRSEPFSVVASSQVYFVRQCLAALAAWLLIFGIIGLHLSRTRAGAFGTIVFLIALTGGIGLFSLEYGQAFTVHDYALNAPQALDRALATPGGPLPLGAMMVIGGFYLGWLLIAISLLVTRDYPRLAAGLILGGMIAAPVLHATGTFSVYAGIVASLIIGAGWFTIGLRMVRAPSAG